MSSIPRTCPRSSRCRAAFAPKSCTTCWRPWPASARSWASRSRPSSTPPTPQPSPMYSSRSWRAPMSATEQPTSLLRPLVEDLAERREKAKLGGGEEKIARQHDQGKLTARERLDLLIDEGTFCEFGIHGQPHLAQRAMDGREAPADGVVTGYGKVDGRLVAVAAYDFTVMAGSMGMTGEMKVARLREMALTKRMPMV